MAVMPFLKNLLLRWAGRLPFAEILRLAVDFTRTDRRRLYRSETAELRRLRAEITPALTRRLHRAPARRALFLGMGNVTAAYLETFLRKSFELAGYDPVVLVPRNRVIKQTYRALGCRRLVSMDAFQSLLPRRIKDIGDYGSMDELLAFEFNGIRCGKYAASTLMRMTRCGDFDFSERHVHATARDAVFASVDYASTAERMLDDLQPDAVVFVDRGYSPSGELFDACIKRGLPAYTWNAAHRNNTVMLKRYTVKNSDVHPSSLSADTWSKLQNLDWREDRWNAVRDELLSCYRSGEWYGEVGTQLNKALFERRALQKKLSLDPAKKTAVIFPHIFWDATFFWGVDLFGSYESWFIETLRGACANDRLNWVIKVHPANLVKDVRDGFRGEHSELTAIRKVVGTLPVHIKLIPADTDISTLSLYQVMDYCLTVRGTVGVEAACFGVPTLTAGTGRYDRLGFTHDFQSREEYRKRLANLESLPGMTTAQTDLARRYAYGLFLCRPASLQSFCLEYRKDLGAQLYTASSEQARRDIASCDDIQRIAAWISSGAEDYFSAPRLIAESTVA